MNWIKYLCVIAVLAAGAITFNGETNLSNTPGYSCTSNMSQRSVATDSYNRLHVVWYDEGDTLSKYRDLGQDRPLEGLGFHIKSSKSLQFFYSNIFYRRSTDGGATWENTVRLTDVDSASIRWPSIATNDMNIVHCVWTDDRWGTDVVYYRRSTDGGANWGPETVLGDTAVESGAPSIATGSFVHVVWREPDTLYRIVYKRSTNDGSSWESPDTLTTAGTVLFRDGDALPCPSMAASNNLVHLVFQDARGDSAGEVYYKRSTDNGQNWETDERLTPIDTLITLWPTVASSGNLVYVVWLQQKSPIDSAFQCYFKRSTDGGTSWQDTVCLIPEATIDYMFGTPQVTAKATTKGQLVGITWGDFRDGNPEIYFRASTDGGASWGAAIRVTQDTMGSYQPSAVIDNSGYMHIVWTDDRDGNCETYYKKYALVGIEEREFEKTLTLSLSNRPNPFGRCTWIRFTVSPKTGESAHTSLKIYNVSGRLIRTLVQEERGAGTYIVSLDAKDSKGRAVKNGIYFCRLRVNDSSATKKMVLIE